MLTFDAPQYLFLQLLVPAAVYYRHFFPRRGGHVVFPFRIWRGEGFYPHRPFLRIVLFCSSLAFWGGVCLLLATVAGPSLSTRRQVYLSRGVDIMIVLDESPSMSAQDFPPVNRFETAKDVIRDFVGRRENDPIGLVSFSREAALRVPPTLDYQALLRRLESLTIMDLGDGTAVGMGVAVATLHLRSSSADEKVIILLTDGESNAGEIAPITAAEIAAQSGLRIYTIGIGTEGDIPLEFTDPNTGKVYRGMFHGGFDEELLQAMAETSGGSYFRAGTRGSLEAVFQAIDSIETTERRFRVEVESVELYRLFILAGLALLMVDFATRKLFLREVL
jgi:Ca-activated chloride channel homolog